MTHTLVRRGSDGLARAALDVLCWREAEVLVSAGGTALVAGQGLTPSLSLAPPPATHGTPQSEAINLRHVGAGRLLQAAAAAQGSVVKVVDYAACQDCAGQEEQQADHYYCHSPPSLESLNLSVVLIF